MEKVNILPNGQWKLEKALKTKNISKIRQWQQTGMRDHLKDLPALEGKQKQKSLQQISQESDSRVNSKTGEKEHKLFRASSSKQPYHGKELSSWTTDSGFAHYWGDIINTPDENDPNWKKPDTLVHHAWIPEKHIHSHVSSVTGTQHEKGGESEVLVHPHDVNIFHTEDPKVSE